MSEDLLFLAGRKARAYIREKGLEPEDISAVAGASGAAKWLIISELDKIIFSQWMKARKSPLLLFGTSIGSWKLAAAARNDPASALEELAQAYIHQYYGKKVSPAEVTSQGHRILDTFIPRGRVSEILSHPVMRLSLSAVRCKGIAASDNIPFQLLGLGMASLANVISRDLLRVFFERTVFHDNRIDRPLFQENDFSTRRVRLDERNLHAALLASGSIPVAMRGVRDIPGAPSGIYRDGGILDYHSASFCRAEENKVILYPHFYHRLIPGWFDKPLAWRKPDAVHLENMLVLAPSPEFISRLPYGRIPSREDFRRFRGYDDVRVAFWKEATARGKRLADDFMDSVLSGSIRTRVRILDDFPG